MLREEARIQINYLEHKEEINIQPGQKGETRIKQTNKQTKTKDSISRLWDISKHANIWIIGIPEEKEQEIVNLFEKIMKEYFPHLVKEIDIQVQEAQRIPKKLAQRGPRHHTP